MSQGVVIPILKRTSALEHEGKEVGETKVRTAKRENSFVLECVSVATHYIHKRTMRNVFILFIWPHVRESEINKYFIIFWHLWIMHWASPYELIFIFQFEFQCRLNYTMYFKTYMRWSYCCVQYIFFKLVCNFHATVMLFTCYRH